jgi:hypothetical protein
MKKCSVKQTLINKEKKRKQKEKAHKWKKLLPHKDLVELDYL